MDKKQVSFLPFSALNEFMRPDYRLKVIQETLGNLNALPEKQQSQVNQAVKKLVQVPGFRNSLQAPTPLKVKPAAKSFEKSASFVAVILSAWSDLQPDLRQQVFDLLTSRGWELLPIEADRTKLPGFLTTWPKDEDFSVLNQAFRDAQPETTASEDDVSLMAVWLAGRLPLDEENAAQAGDAE